jgi:hypothetical protein
MEEAAQALEVAQIEWEDGPMFHEALQVAINIVRALKEPK